MTHIMNKYLNMYRIPRKPTIDSFYKCRFLYLRLNTAHKCSTVASDLELASENASNRAKVAEKIQDTTLAIKRRDINVLNNGRKIDADPP